MLICSTQLPKRQRDSCCRVQDDHWRRADARSGAASLVLLDAA
jgi:hypothetical protein